MTTRSKILIGLGTGILIIVGYFGYLFATTRSHSPADVAQFSSDSLTVDVTYCRPYKKGRLVFGSEEQDALQTYGDYWRVGANEATQVKFAQDVLFAGKPLKAGEYVLYAVPGANTWTIGLNSELGRWGALEVDHELDVMQVKVNSGPLAAVQEQFLIDFSPSESGVNLNLKWDQTLVPIEIRLP